MNRGMILVAMVVVVSLATIGYMTNTISITATPISFSQAPVRVISTTSAFLFLLEYQEAAGDPSDTAGEPVNRIQVVFTGTGGSTHKAEVTVVHTAGTTLFCGAGTISSTSGLGTAFATKKTGPNITDVRNITNTTVEFKSNTPPC